MQFPIRWSVLLAIADVVRNHPNTIAIEDGERLVSYAELWRRSERLAGVLNGRLAQDRSPVAVALDRSVDQLVAILGILLSGRAYVPIDSSQPESRVAQMFELATPLLCIATRRTHDFQSPCATSDLQELLEQAESPGNIESLGDEDAAYIVFTSGSTGTPKGIAMRSGVVGNLMSWQYADVRLGLSARTLFSTPVIFDVSFQEIFGCLGTGGTLVVLDERTRKQPQSLLRFIEQQKIERIYLPFVALQQLAETAAGLQLWPEELQDVITAGEQLQITPAIVGLFDALGDCCLHNHYGPAETHVVTAYTLTGRSESWAALPPIGTAIDNVGVYLLDEDGKPVKPGENGEIFLAGSCITDGYLGDETLTAQKYLPDPFSDSTNSLMYKTSDLGRVSNDGLIEWTGRCDTQVKIRGYRVELGEVETVLSQHPSIQQAVVVPHRKKFMSELLAYATLDPASPEPETKDITQETLNSVSKWSKVWDETYSKKSTVFEPTSNFTGWNSSYTGEPIELTEMQEWLDKVVERIDVDAASTVLEIGCGSGLVLFRLAPAARSYMGLDFSEAAIDELREQVASIEDLAEKVTLDCRAAHDLEQFAESSFSTVIINSVTQHFPDIGYLIDVVRRAVRLLKPGGQLFIGDITSLPMRQTFIASIEREKASPHHTVAELLNAVEHRLQMDSELALDAELFQRLTTLMPDLGPPTIQVKASKHRNEMSNYRYDVSYRVKTSKPVEKLIPMLEKDWEDLTPAQKEPEYLLELVSSGCLVKNVPNARVNKHWGQLQQLVKADRSTLVRDLPEVAPDDGVDPNRLYELARAISVEVEIRPGREAQNLVVTPPGAGLSTSHIVSSIAELYNYASDPSLRLKAEAIIPDLRRFLHDRLPDYMQPTRYIIVKNFPTTATGKIDRNALPPPSRARPSQALPYVAVTNDFDRRIELGWCDILDLDKIGLDDSFFDLGGNSLLIHDLARRLSQDMGEQISALQLLTYPTIRTLSQMLQNDPETSPNLEQEKAQSRGELQRQARLRSRPVRPRNNLQ